MPVARARTVFGWLLLFLALSLAALLPGPAAASENEATELVVYVREGCPHCAHAKAFLAAQQQHRPSLKVRYRWVDREPEAARELEALFEAAGAWPPGVPTFVRGERMLVGFDNAVGADGSLLALIGDEPARTTAPASPLPVGWSVESIGLPAFTLAMGLLDGFNPCAMWVLLFLLSLLVRLGDRRRMALIAGTFVLTSGLVYYAFMAAWLNLFLAVGLSGPVRIALAVVAIVFAAVNIKDFLAWGRGPSLSIPDAAKPGIYARVRRVLQGRALGASLLGVAGLAVMVNFVELLCTAGLPAIYTAVLSQHDVVGLARYGYLALYITGYLVDDALMVGLAVAALSSRKLTERAGRWLKLAGGLVMLALGAILLLRPDWIL
jgi:glutaredoxin